MHNRSTQSLARLDGAAVEKYLKVLLHSAHARQNLQVPAEVP